MSWTWRWGLFAVSFLIGRYPRCSLPRGVWLASLVVEKTQCHNLLFLLSFSWRLPSGPLSSPRVYPQATRAPRVLQLSIWWPWWGPESEMWVKVLDAQSCLTLCDPMHCSPPGSSVHGILQGRILGWVAMPFSRGSSQPRDQTQVSWIVGRFFTIWAIREAHYLSVNRPKKREVIAPSDHPGGSAVKNLPA